MRNLAIRCAVALFTLLVALPASPLLASPGIPQIANTGVHPSTQRVEVWTEEWDPVARRWTRIDLPSARRAPDLARLRSATPAAPLARFGPFVVLDHKAAALVGTTNSSSPAQFEQMLAAFPRLDRLEFVDAPGTVNDIANLELGRHIRAKGFSTHVPASGSVRSGAVELFLAGVQRTMEPGARFAVHSWRDSYGRGPADFPDDHAVNRLYLDYYMEMGMNDDEARAFYAMTNSVPHSSALWFGPDQMRLWLMRSEGTQCTPYRIAQIAYQLENLF